MRLICDKLSAVRWLYNLSRNNQQNYKINRILLPENMQIRGKFKEIRHPSPRLGLSYMSELTRSLWQLAPGSDVSLATS